ncbi:TetR/AcrR family transcriptional regulator [Rheinheimera maricola]|uniref:TetR/AcrR family transcriptional regulator n=1 Tax=Rheinheimera maricola TaxID=2793282 RepID=A0ABS7XCZ0_9GAMM|nr:helix-turn-helix domain-containing protein [Rheinheimera maricola]MBZ9613221.1 TetR/AcrR family transcriptional regulator [Rheinheimera maricola]
MKQNAISAEAKAQRRQDFLAAARQLFLQQQRLPAVADIAMATGLAKGTVYRYFKSKEQIFLALLSEDFSHLFRQLQSTIAELPQPLAAAAAPFASAYLKGLQQSDSLLPLLALLNAVLEQNLPQQQLLLFKQQLAQALDGLGAQLAARFSELTAASASQLLLHSYALTLGLYQSTRMPAAVMLLVQQAGLTALQRDFATELSAAVRRLWLGAVQG